ncbi:Ubiquitin-conjugating enzyme [Phaffia rhodozyma]|uniref:Ubiquitin-conjugating enzyme n=1 Tax=Phaffia rhodozyma TaxID=264483 RepID=A0A0F7SHL7_PHARH|nr:Ubiquitin-conjugating enzyme [Phaffia rhodozyma]
MSQSFYLGDIVRVKETNERAMILRTYAEQQDEDDDTHHHQSSIPALYPNELALSVLYAKDDMIKYATRRVVSQDTVVLEDRSLSCGDAVKRSWSETESGQIMEVEVMSRLRHVLTGEPVEGWVSSTELVGALAVEVGDRVIYNDWLGVIEKVNEEATVECQLTNHYYKLLDMAGRLDPGCTAENIFCKKSALPAIPSLASNPTFIQEERDLSKETICQVRCLAVLVNWVAFSQKVPIEEQDDRHIPSRFWYGENLAKLTHVTSDVDHLARVGSKVRFKSPQFAEAHSFKPTLHKEGTIEFDIMQVVETKTKVTVLWQNGTETTESSINLIPHIYLNDHECWPGDHVMFKGDDDKRQHAVVQSYSSSDRTAEIRIVSGEDPAKDEIKLVSAIEVDPRGSRTKQHSVHPGEIVLTSISSNGYDLPHIPKIGHWEDPLEPDYIESVLYAQALVASRFSPSDTPFGFSNDVSKIDWYGEVKRLRPEDGMVEVVLPSGKVVVEHPGTLFCLIEEGEDIEGDGMEYEDEEGEGEGEGNQFQLVDGQAEGDDQEWEDNQDGARREKGWIGQRRDGEEDYGMEVDDWASVTLDHQDRGYFPKMDPFVSLSDRTSTSAEPQQPTVLIPPAERSIAAAPENVTTTDPSSSVELDVEPTQTTAPTSNTVEMLSLPDLLNQASSSPSTGSFGADHSPGSMKKDDPSWLRFDVLEHAPLDHHFLNKVVEKTNSSFMTRLKKEFKVLASSLPDTILVRSYGDRLDLFRCLIFGPPGTPYVDAPLVIDFYLNPSRFPFDPPLAHFHSWTAGKGRINPNLYEEGKVCLSILGTWSGSSTEIWSPNRSSLLQTLVSIQGLVLVREPYFCEPSYENLRGTPEVKIHSEDMMAFGSLLAYIEKAFVLTRAFILHALKYPIQGFESEISTFYFARGKLENVIDNSRRLIELGEQARGRGSGSGSVMEVGKEEEEGDGVGVLTMGGIIPLKDKPGL